MATSKMATIRILSNVVRLGVVDRAVIDSCRMADGLKPRARRRVLAIAAALYDAEQDHLLDQDQPDGPNGPVWPMLSREE